MSAPVVDSKYKNPRDADNTITFSNDGTCVFHDTFADYDACGGGVGHTTAECTWTQGDGTVELTFSDKGRNRDEIDIKAGEKLTVRLENGKRPTFNVVK